METSFLIYPGTALAAAIGYETYRRWQHRRRTGGLPYPPGPPPKPVLGNLPQMPTEECWLTFADWGKQYGPLTYLNLAGQPILVLNSHQATIDLLEKRSDINSDRARAVMAGELVGLNEYTFFLQSDDPKHKLHRKLYHHALNSSVIGVNYGAIQEKWTTKLLGELLSRPDDFFNAIKYHTGALLVEGGHGRLGDGEADFIKQGEQITSIFFGTVQGFIVDFIPALRFLPSWFPGASFKRSAETWKMEVVQGEDSPVDMVKRLRASGEAERSFTSLILEENDRMGGGLEVETMIRKMVGGFFGGGWRNMHTLLHVFMLAMATFPEVQRRAQKEIDRVTGGKRLPTLKDRESLPYITNVLLETWRWHPIGPVGIPHMSSQDSTYNGYFIPAGTLIFPNVWSTAMDLNIYPGPHDFNPDRFSGDAIKSGRVVDPTTFVYGFGPRICPANHFAQAGLWITVAKILAAFDIKKPIDPKTGAETDPEVTFGTGLISDPSPFTCRILPRSESLANVVRQAVSELQG